MSEVPDTMKAMVGDRAYFARLTNVAFAKPWGDGVKITSVPVPKLSDNEILVKVHAVALNPTDFKHIDMVAPRGAIIGNDFAGTVAKIGPNVPEGKWQIGDRVAAVVHGGLYPDIGSFAEYLKCSADLAWRVPPSLTDEEAATYGVSAFTAMMALNTRLSVPWVDSNDAKGGSIETPVFIYAGSTAAGLFSIQLAKLAGVKVVTTASPHSFDLVKQYGADEVYDYHSPTAAKQIAEDWPNIDRALDCFSEGGSVDFCIDVVRGNKGAKVVTLLDTGKKMKDEVEIEMILGYWIFNTQFQWMPPLGPKFSGSKEDQDAAIRFCSSLNDLSKRLKPPPLKKMDNGLENLVKGLDMLRQGKVSGGKLVSTL